MPKQMSLIVLIVGLLSGCASTPDVKFFYYPSKANSNVTVTQTVACNKAKTDLVVLHSTEVNTVYSADYSKDPYSIEIKKLDGIFSDTDVDFIFFEDGRLKSINQSTTGQGETIFKSAIALGAALVPLGGGPPEAKVISECDIIEKWGGDKPVALIYNKNIQYQNDIYDKAINLDLAPGSAGLYRELNKYPRLPTVQVTINLPTIIQGSARYNSSSSGSSSDEVPLTLQKTKNVKVSVKASGSEIWSGTITVPGEETYDVPIPKAALFGKQTFSLTLSETGAITEIKYGKLTGVTGALNTATSVSTAAAPESTSAKVAETKAQADLIYQQQRLTACQANPAKCQ